MKGIGKMKMNGKKIRETEQQLQTFFAVEKQVDYSVHLQQTTESAQSVRQAILYRHRISFWALVGKQLKFIALKIWLLQGMVLSALCAFFLYFYDKGGIWGSEYIPPKILGLCGGIIAMSAAPLLLRPTRYKMLELERSTYFSNRGGILSQLLFIGMGDVGMLTVLVLLTKQYHIAADGVFLFLVIPFLTAATACFMLWARTSPSVFQKTAIPACILSSFLICEVAEKSRWSLSNMPLFIWDCYAFICVCILYREYRRLLYQENLENML